MTNQPQQRAVLVKEVGKPVVIGTRAIPTPKDNEVLIKVKSVMILPHDAYARDWGLYVENYLPYILGSNVGGVVEQVGKSVTKVKKGDKVFGLADVMGPYADQSGLQEYSILKATPLAKVPEGATMDQMVTLPTNLMTSFMVLFTSTYGFGWPAPWESNSESLADETLVIIGGGTVVGKFGVQFAKMAGIGRIIVIAGLSGEEQLKEMGATHVIDRNTSNDDIVRQVHAITGENGVKHIYDCRSMTFELATALVPKEEQSRVFAVHPIEELEKMAKERPKCKAVFVEGSSTNMAPHEEGFWSHVGEWVQNGSIRPGDFRTVDGLDQVDEINATLDGYAVGKSGAQLIVHP